MSMSLVLEERKINRNVQLVQCRKLTRRLWFVADCCSKTVGIASGCVYESVTYRLVRVLMIEHAAVRRLRISGRNLMGRSGWVFSKPYFTERSLMSQTQVGI